MTDNGNSIQIIVESKDTEITGTFTNEFSAAFVENGQAGAWDADRNSRTITITENNDTFIEGTFSFTGNNLKDKTTKKFTDGSFRARKPKKK